MTHRSGASVVIEDTVAQTPAGVDCDISLSAQGPVFLPLPQDGWTTLVEVVDGSGFDLYRTDDIHASDVDGVPSTFLRP